MINSNVRANRKMQFIVFLFLECDYISHLYYIIFDLYIFSYLIDIHLEKILIILKHIYYFFLYIRICALLQMYQ